MSIGITPAGEEKFMRKGIVAAAITATLSAGAAVFAFPANPAAAAPSATCSLQNGMVQGSGFTPDQSYNVTRGGQTISRVSAGANGNVQVGVTGGGPIAVGGTQCSSSGSGAGGNASESAAAAAATAKGTAAAQQAVRSGASQAQAVAIGRQTAQAEAQRLGLPPTVVNQVTNNTTNIVNNTISGGTGNTIGGTQIGGQGNTQGGTQGGTGNTQGGTQGGTGNTQGGTQGGG
ncbi:hypothetical protein GTW40_01310, partial [Streptomyces sp. SID4985]|nr:hypothetical protein [Streptomyces sp. SID4985]